MKGRISGIVFSYNLASKQTLGICYLTNEAEEKFLGIVDYAKITQ